MSLKNWDEIGFPDLPPVVYRITSGEPGKCGRCGSRLASVAESCWTCTWLPMKGQKR
jgi:hypothetical protein